MFLQRSAAAVARRAAVAPALRRTFATSMIRREFPPALLRLRGQSSAIGTCVIAPSSLAGGSVLWPSHRLALPCIRAASTTRDTMADMT